MSSTVGTASGDLFSDLSPSSCADLGEKFAALAEIERHEAVLLSRKAQMVASIAEDVVRRQVERERQYGKGIFSFAAREAALLELGPALGVSSRGASAMLAFAEDVTVNYPEFGAKLAAGG